MTWDAYHRRAEVLRSVLEHADDRRDGRLPMDLPGVAETFGDETSLAGVLQLRWHTRLAGAVERELMRGSVDLETAVVQAWRRTAGELAGVRAILDACAERPASEEMARMLERARRKDRTMMAAMAGKASPADRRAAAVGRTIEEKARAAYHPAAPRDHRPVGRHADTARPSLVARAKAHLVAQGTGGGVRRT